MGQCLPTDTFQDANEYCNAYCNEFGDAYCDEFGDAYCDEFGDAYGLNRNRESAFPQVVGENRNFQISEESLQPKPKPKSEPKPEAHSEENGLGFEARERILDYAVNLSLKKCPPSSPAGERLLVKNVLTQC